MTRSPKVKIPVALRLRVDLNEPGETMESIFDFTDDLGPAKIVLIYDPKNRVESSGRVASLFFHHNPVDYERKARVYELYCP